MVRAVSTSTGKTHWPQLALLCGAILAVFGPVLSFEFVRWDDDINITQNPLLTKPWSWSLLAEFFSGDQAMRFKPLHWLLFRGLHGIFGFVPAGWHAFNLLLHLSAALLFYRVLVRLLGVVAGGGEEMQSRWLALLGAALWALHPLRAEPVAWATASTYPLTTVCLLASFLAYLKASDEAPKRRWLVWSWIFAVAGYASYPVGIAYGLWLITVDRWLLPNQPGRGPLWTPRWNRVWCAKHGAFLAPAALAVAVTVWTRIAAPGIFSAAPDVETVDVSSRVRMALAALSSSVRSFFWPVDLTPNMHPLKSGATLNPEVIALAVLTLAILALAWALRRKRPLFTFVVFGFVGLALPTLGWTERPTWPVDRYSYLIHLVLVGGIVGAGWRWARNEPTRFLAIACVGFASVAATAFFARRQAMIWKNSSTLFAHMEQHPEFGYNPRQQAHIYRLWGNEEVSRARTESAGILFGKAQEVYVRAILEATGRGDYEEALALMTYLERYFFPAPVMRREKAHWLLQLNRGREALHELRAVQPELPDDERLKALLVRAEKQLAAETPGPSATRTTP